jgi:iron complex outermembrane receptor protein
MQRVSGIGTFGAVSYRLLGGFSLLLTSIAATGQTSTATQTSSTTAQAEPGGGGLAEIIVTARRREERLQDVPQTVNAVTAESVEKLNILRFDDVQSVVPGLTLSSGNNGYTTAATMRGASYQVESGARPTVEFYLNDAPIESVFLFQTMYDLGQIEVLRGPQGTLRGRASPSGSITVTSHRADLDNFGGYADLTVTDQDRQDVQGAVNLPLIRDHLALRVAGLWDENQYNDVKSISNPRDPFEHSQSGRATLSWEANDALSGNVTYQLLHHRIYSYVQVESFSLSEPSTLPSSPLITPSARLGITDGANAPTQSMQIVTGNADYRFAGQKLSYVGAYNTEDVDALSPQDAANAVPNFEFEQNLHTHLNQRSHELRLSSEERLFGWMDYTLGGFISQRSVPNDVTQATLVGLPLPTGFHEITVVNTPINTQGNQEEKSVFGNLTAHIGDHLELAGGLRRIDWKDQNAVTVSGATLANTTKQDTPIVYNFSASYLLTDDFMVYTNYGKSWREGPNAIGIFRPLTPRLSEFTQLKNETSESYEVGFKSSFLEHRLRINASLYHQDFSNFLYRGPAVYYVNLTQAGAAPATFNFLANVDATVNGAELEIDYEPVDRWIINTSFAYSNGKIKNGLVACNDFNGDGIPDTNPIAPTVAQIAAAAGGSEAVATCRINDRLSTAPNLSGTLQSEYTLPISGSLDSFARGLYTFYGQNPQDPHNPYDNVSYYGLLNLYLGVRSNTGNWEVSLFGKNLANSAQVLSVGNGPQTTSYTNPITRSGATLSSLYATASVPPKREFGVNVRYIFGSH